MLFREATLGYRPSDRQKIIGQNLNYPVRHPYFSEYQSLQKVCLLILLHQKLPVSSGPKRIAGILFDGAWLWEEYLNTLLKDIFYHPMNKEHRGAQHLFNGKAGIIYPDFISKEADNRRIADAKYKLIDNICSRDYLQILAYRFRFDAKNGYFLYPETENAPDLQLWRNQGSTYEKNVRIGKDILGVKHGLKIPKDVIDYSDFAKKIESSEPDFIRFL